VAAEEIFVVLALFVPIGIVHRPSLRLYLSQNQLVDYLKFRIDLVEGFLVKYSVLHGWSGHHDGDNIAKRPMEHQFPGEYLPQKRSVNQHDGVLSAASVTKERRLYTVVKTVMLFCASVGVLWPTLLR
jgi:hypothetical protein